MNAKFDESKQRGVEPGASIPMPSSNPDLGEIREGYAVFAKGTASEAGTDKKLGEVDRVERGYIKLKKDTSPDGNHHWIPFTWVSRVEGSSLYLNKTDKEFQREQLNQLPSNGPERIAV